MKKSHGFLMDLGKASKQSIDPVCWIFDTTSDCTFRWLQFLLFEVLWVTRAVVTHKISLSQKTLVLHSFSYNNTKTHKNNPTAATQPGRLLLFLHLTTKIKLGIYATCRYHLWFSFFTWVHVKWKKYSNEKIHQAYEKFIFCSGFAGKVFCLYFTSTSADYLTSSQILCLDDYNVNILSVVIFKLYRDFAVGLI